MLLQSATAILLQSATSVITKCDQFYYKVRPVLLQSVTGITKWDVITKCDGTKINLDSFPSMSLNQEKDAICTGGVNDSQNNANNEEYNKR